MRHLWALGALSMLLAMAQCSTAAPSAASCSASSCGGRCVDVSSDNENCGACGVACPASSRCTDGACRSFCATTEALCGANCANLGADPSNCGACGVECPRGMACSAGQCVDCGPTQTLCAASSPSGSPYCASLTSDDANCGACGAACPSGQACVGSVCVDPCAAGVTYCAPASCVDLSTDAAHCGECGHDCLGSACLGGRCVPTVLATEQYSAGVVAVSAGEVYWGYYAGVYGSGIRHCSVSGCGKQALDLASFTKPPDALDVSNGWATWTVDGGVVSCALNACSPAVFVVLPNSYTGPNLAVDAANVYGTLYELGASSDTVWKCSRQGCANQPSALTKNATHFPMAIAVDGANVYWGNDNFFSVVTDYSVYTCPIGGCGSGGPKLLVSQAGHVRQIVVGPTNLYWIDESGTGAILSCAKGGCNDTPTILASNQPAPWAIAVDGANVYWSSSKGGTVSKCALGGCGGHPTVLAANLATPHGIALDAQWVYFSENAAARVSKVAK